MSQKKDENILLIFLEELIKDEKERQVLELIFSDMKDEDILEKIINYRPPKKKK
jgi:hypothetical protein